MGNTRKEALRIVFDRHIKLAFHAAAITSNARLVAYREFNEAMELTEMGEVFRD